MNRPLVNRLLLILPACTLFVLAANTLLKAETFGLRCRTVNFLPPQAESRNGDLCTPTNHRDVAIILVHGGAGVQGSRTGMKPWAERYGQEGYVTFAIDYYLFTPGRSPTPVFPKPEREVKAAIQYLRRNAASLGISPNRILVHGTSAGAQLGGKVLVTPNDPYFNGLERWQHISDRANGFIGFYGGYTGAMYKNEDYYYGGSRDSPSSVIQERWAKANAISQAAKASGPTIMFHGDQDEIAPYQQTIRFAQALRVAGKEVSYTIVPGANHTFDRTRELNRRLTPEGEQAAQQIVVWLGQQYPSGTQKVMR